MPDARAEIESDSESIAPVSTYRTSGRATRIGPTTRTDPRYTRFSVICGDSRSVLTGWPTGCVDCVVTSPPYYRLRSYDSGPWEIGQEATPQQYIARLVETFAEVHRVLSDSGTLWLNIGDCYAAGGQNSGSTPEKLTDKQRSNGGCVYQRTLAPAGTKPKDLFGIPWMLAFALRDFGWYLRSDIIWEKPNPMPESVKDRPTRSHEYLFLLTKSDRYYYDADAIAEPCVSTDLFKFTDNGIDKQRGHSRRHSGFNGRYAERLAESGPPITRNKRDVWTIATEPSPEPHFAMFPTALVTPCILAGSPRCGLVLDPFCGLGRALTTALTYSRRAIGIDLNPEYCSRARSRVYAEIRGLEEAL